MAEIEGFHYEDTLTGFKWIGNRAILLEKKGYYVPFGFEEAIGYMFPAMEHDKDGISASIVFLQAYCKWKIDHNLDPLNVLENGFKNMACSKSTMAIMSFQIQLLQKIYLTTSGMSTLLRARHILHLLVKKSKYFTIEI